MARPSRKRIVNWDDDDTETAYPADLFGSAENDEWYSPTKTQRTFQQRPNRRKDIQRRRKRPLVEDREVVGDSQLGAVVDLGVSGDSEMDSSRIPDAEEPDEDLDAYVEAINAHVAGFYYLEGNIFAVQGWDALKSQSTERWYHLEYQELGSEIVVGCTCPLGLDGTCVHCRFFLYFDAETLIDMRRDAGEGTHPALLFLQHSLQNEEVLSLFSVRSSSSSALRGRAIVRHVGLAGSWEGTWRCSKDSSTTQCTHISRVRELLGAMVDVDGGVQGAVPMGRMVNDLVCAQVSHRRVNVPSWAALPGENQTFPSPPPFRVPPETPMALDATSSCPCPTGRTFYNPLGPVVIRKCKIYTLFAVYEHDIALQPCPTCPPSRRRFIGPDLGDQGVFNYNNSILVSHELLDEYTSAFTGSETPFSAWVLHMSHRYARTGQVFMGEDLFRSVWFAYISLQDFGEDMKCSKCGDYPETVIWDGITLAFGRKHIRDTLRPPTSFSDAACIRSKIRHHPRQQLIEDAKLRRNLRLILDPPTLDGINLDDEEVGLLSSPSKDGRDISHEVHLVSEHLERIETVVEGLEGVCPALRKLFEDQYRASLYAARIQPASVYKRFFVQISAEESVLQLQGTQWHLANTDVSQDITEDHATWATGPS